MVSRGQVHLKHIKKMLGKCAPGYTLTEKTHHLHLVWRDRVSRLPKGQHGSKTEIEMGHIRQMVRALDILECAKKHLPQLR
jgi:hypothetical protein